MTTAPFFNPALHARASDGTFREMFHAEADFTLPASATSSGIDLSWVQSVKDDLGLVLGAGDPEAQARIDAYGGIDLAVVAVGDAVASRAEELAGVTSNQVRAGWGTRMSAVSERYETAKEIFQNFKPAVDVTNTDAYWDIRQEFASAGQELRLTRDGRDDETLMDMRLLSDGYLAALSEVRPMGGDLKVHAKSDERGIEFFKAAAQYFPTDFIDASNADTPLMALSTAGRAHYKDRTIISDKVRQPLIVETWKSPYEEYDGGHPTPYREWNPTGKFRDGVSVHNPNTHKYEQLDNVEILESAGFQVIEPGEMFRAKKDGTPWGGGWEKWVHPNNEREYWRKPRMEDAYINEQVVSNILVDGNINPHVAGMDPNMSTALHEFAHRSEAVVNRPPMRRSTVHAVNALRSVPVIDLELEFLKRRTTFEDGRQELERMYPETRGNKEMTRPDHFPHRYMGKDYGRAYTEIMSVGMEAVFAGTQGGLIGIGPNDADTETRDFVLGMLAVATGKRVTS